MADNSAQSYIGVGSRLRDARRKAGYSIDDISTNLRIRYEYIEAIEQGDFAKLPGIAYLNGFLRTYAEYLGFNGEEIIRGYKSEASAWFPNYRFTAMPDVPKDSLFPQKWVMILCLFGFVIMYSYWHKINVTDEVKVNVVEEPSHSNLTYLADQAREIESMAVDYGSKWMTYQMSKPKLVLTSEQQQDFSIAKCSEISISESISSELELIADSCYLTTEEMYNYAKNLAMESKPIVTNVEQSLPKPEYKFGNYSR